MLYYTKQMNIFLNNADDNINLALLFDLVGNEMSK